jgi:hypothetical protein
MPMPRMPKSLLAILAGVSAAGILAGCDELPRDPEDTTDEVSGSLLRVGWIAGAEPTAAERAAVAALAARLGAVVETRQDTVHQLVPRLEEGALHLVMGALPEQTPFAARIGLSAPVGTVMLGGETQPTVIAIRSGENRFLLLVNEAIRKATP